MPNKILELCIVIVQSLLVYVYHQRDSPSHPKILNLSSVTHPHLILPDILNYQTPLSPNNFRCMDTKRLRHFEIKYTGFEPCILVNI